MLLVKSGFDAEGPDKLSLTAPAPELELSPSIKRFAAEVRVLKEFKDFIVRGNVLDMAVGIIIGAAFGKIISLFVSDIMMPPLGMLMGKVDFSNLYVNLSSREFSSLAEAKKAGAPTINYGLFINQVIDFVLVAAAVFVLVKVVNSIKKKDAAAPEAAPAPTKDQVLLGEIRDLLKSR